MVYRSRTERSSSRPRDKINFDQEGVWWVLSAGEGKYRAYRLDARGEVAEDFWVKLVTPEIGGEEEHGEAPGGCSYRQ